MRHIYTVIGCMLLGTASAWAQPPGPPSHVRGAGDIERLAILLDLDAYQKDRVQTILNEQREQLQALRRAHEETGERPSFEEMHAAREQAYNDTLTKLQSVLSELQMTKFKLLMEPPAGGPGGRRGPRPPGGGPPTDAPQ